MCINAIELLAVGMLAMCWYLLEPRLGLVLELVNDGVECGDDLLANGLDVR